MTTPDGPRFEGGDGVVVAEPPESTNTVLYIEDNASNIALMRSLVARRPGWQMILADHGAQGLEMARANAIDLVLLDLHLPDTDGFEVLQSLRADPTTQHLKIVVVSADANQHQIDRLLTAGADAYLTKPLNVAAVLQLFY